MLHNTVDCTSLSDLAFHDDWEGHFRGDDAWIIPSFHAVFQDANNLRSITAERTFCFLLHGAPSTCPRLRTLRLDCLCYYRGVGESPTTDGWDTTFEVLFFAPHVSCGGAIPRTVHPEIDADR